MTTRDDYAKRLKAHLKETKSHASQVSKRIKQLGGTPETVSLPGPEGLTKAAEAVSGALGKAKAAAQGPLHAVRGSGEQERMLQQRPDGVSGGSVGDRDLHGHRRRSPRRPATSRPRSSPATSCARRSGCSSSSATLLPELSADVAHDEIPVAEIDGPGVAPNGGGLEAEEPGQPRHEGEELVQPRHEGVHPQEDRVRRQQSEERGQGEENLRIPLRPGSADRHDVGHVYLRQIAESRAGRWGQLKAVRPVRPGLA